MPLVGSSFPKPIFMLGKCEITIFFLNFAEPKLMLFQWNPLESLYHFVFVYL
jgi:hypothetical protein